MIIYFKRILHYLNYRLFSYHRRGFGIHSPFVFSLVTETFRNKTGSHIVLMVEEIRKRRLSDNTVINVKDLGSGSGKMKGSKRKVSEITKYSSVPEKYGVLLANLAARFGGNAIAELGTSTGISTMYMAAGSPQSTVYTIEGCPETSSIAAENFEAAGLENITLLTGSFEDKISEIKTAAGSFGMIYIDGNHRKEPLLSYFNELSSTAGEETVIVIDDIYLNSEMEDAWKQIKNDPAVTVTVDIYRMGLVFFRKGIARLDLTIMY